MSSAPKVKLSDAIAAPIISAYKAGGMGLAFLTLGALLMLAAFRWNDKGALTYFILGIGTLLIFSTLTFFYFKDLKKLINAHKCIQKNAELEHQGLQSVREFGHFKRCLLNSVDKQRLAKILGKVARART